MTRDEKTLIQSDEVLFPDLLLEKSFLTCKLLSNLHLNITVKWGEKKKKKGSKTGENKKIKQYYTMRESKEFQFGCKKI